MKRARPSTGSKPQKAKRRDPLDKLDEESGNAGVKDRSQEARASRLEKLRRDGEAAMAEYQARHRITQEKTARLRAARLAGAKEKGGKSKR
jgi:hypothetical protein